MKLLVIISMLALVGCSDLLRGGIARSKEESAKDKKVLTTLLSCLCKHNGSALLLQIEKGYNVPDYGHGKCQDGREFRYMHVTDVCYE
jgi:hypothetical protein